ncbi:MAG: ATP-binding protein [Burkholderiales bacterium]
MSAPPDGTGMQHGSDADHPGPRVVGGALDSAIPTSVAKLAPRSSRGRRWALGVAAALFAALGLVLMFMLAQATNNRELYERNYAWLFAINVLVAVLLSMVIVWAVLRLWLRLRRGKFGSQLLVKLAMIFALVGLLPGLLIYVVSYQFVTRSIESWFDVKVEGALEAGLNLGRATLDTLSSDLANKTRAAADQLAELPDAQALLALERLRGQLSTGDLLLWNGSGQLLASAGQSRYELSPEKPSAQQFRVAREQRVMVVIEGLDDPAAPAASRARINALALAPSANVALKPEPRFLQVIEGLSPTLVANAIAVQEANREYQERALARAGLRRMYIGTLTLSLFLSVFGAVLLAVLLGTQLARPLLVLADGVREVARGDLSPKAVLQGRDELGGLTRAFADMTQQLADARAAVERSIGQVDAARANLQTILDNLTAGVIVLDERGVIRSSNPGATRILRTPLAAHIGRPLVEVPGLEAFAQSVQAHFDGFFLRQGQHALDHWQQSFDLGVSAQGVDMNAINLITRGAELPGNERLLVFDDVSEMVSAQRAQAWGEVARRLAHEIKNPLTPIQLSAERLEMKLGGKVGGAEQAVLTKSVRTIVDQVEALKRLVNEFRDYARLPAVVLQPLDLNALAGDVLHLYANDESHVRLQAELDPACPPIQGDAQQLRQVLHNLLQNAQDASEGKPRREVTLRTNWSATLSRVQLTVCDNGGGFPEAILKRAFEPYVTTKAKGTGLGLAVVKKIIDEHGARIELANRSDADGQPSGAQVSLSFPVRSAVTAG